MSLVSDFSDRVDHLASDELASHCIWLEDVSSSASDRLVLSSQCTVELLPVAELGGLVSTVSHETSKMPSSMAMVPGND